MAGRMQAEPPFLEEPESHFHLHHVAGEPGNILKDDVTYTFLFAIPIQLLEPMPVQYGDLAAADIGELLDNLELVLPGEGGADLLLPTFRILFPTNIGLGRCTDIDHALFLQWYNPVLDEIHSNNANNP